MLVASSGNPAKGTVVQVKADERAEGELSRRRFLRRAGALVAFGAAAPLLAAACGGPDVGRTSAPRQAQGTAVTLYRQEGCSCCATYADYLRDNGFSVAMETVDDLDPVRERYSIPEAAVGCHTSEVEDYIVEGHVPVEAIQRLLAERPEFEGISVTGMPISSPGMGEPNGTPLDVLSFRSGQVNDYMSVTTF